MHRLLFVCHGNICRSPMAEFVMKDLVRKAGLDHSFAISSAATSAEETGRPVYPPARPHAPLPWARPSGKRAVQLQPGDYVRWDRFIGMDEANRRSMTRLFGGDPEHKVHLAAGLRPPRPGSVADPWYTGDFETAWRDISAGCAGLFTALTGL